MQIANPAQITIIIPNPANPYGNVDFTSAKEDVNYSGKWYFYECLFEVTNNATFKMSMTGDSGTWKYGFAGFGIIIVI